jgi:hypothetical protein
VWKKHWAFGPRPELKGTSDLLDYKKRIQAEAKSFHDSIENEFSADSSAHGGKSESPNLTLWLDQNGKLLARVQAVAEKWTRGDVESIKAHSRHAVNYGDPRESARFAFYKDLLAELKKLRKK